MSDYSQVGNEGDFLKAVEEQARQLQSLGLRDTQAQSAADMVDEIGDVDYTRSDDDGNEIIGVRRTGMNIQSPNVMEINFWASIGVPSNVATAIYAMAFSGAVLYVGGNFTKIGGISANYIAKYDTSTGVWSNVGSSTALNGTVRAIAISGPSVYVGDSFTNADSIANADFIALWNGSVWSALGAASLNGTVFTIAISGSNVYVGGSFTNADGIAAADRIALWNGSWSALGSSSLNNSVLAIAISGSNVYVGGNFTNADGIADADYFALWNGAAWSAVGSSLLNNNVEAISILGSNVFIGGNFTTAAGIAGADYIALWDEAALAWSGLGVSSLNNKVTAIAIDGSIVYLGGYFSNANGITDANGIVGWDGETYFLTGSAGVSYGSNVTALALYGSDLYVGGSFLTAGGRASNAIAAYLVRLQSVLAYLEITQQALQDAMVTDVTLYDASSLMHGLMSKLDKIKLDALGGVYSALGLVGANNAATPNTKYDFSADYVALRNSSNQIVVRTNTGTITCDIGVAGSTANGRDQSGAFSASTWVYFYYIWNGTTLATLASATAPTTGPTLPSGYTHWTFINAVYLNASSQLANTVLRGNKVTYLSTQRPVAAGSAALGGAGETAVSVAAYIPPNSLSYTLLCSGSFTNTTTTANTLNIRLITGTGWEGMTIQVQVANIAIWTYLTLVTPNIARNFFYVWGLNAGTRAAYLDIVDYTIPSGAM